RQRRYESLIPGEVVVAEDVEALEDRRDLVKPAQPEGFLQLQVHRAIGPGVGDDEREALRLSLVSQQPALVHAAASRLIVNGVRSTRPERDERARDETVRQPD